MPDEKTQVNGPTSNRSSASQNDGASQLPWAGLRLRDDFQSIVQATVPNEVLQRFDAMLSRIGDAPVSASDVAAVFPKKAATVLAPYLQDGSLSSEDFLRIAVKEGETAGGTGIISPDLFQQARNIVAHHKIEDSENVLAKGLSQFAMAISWAEQNRMNPAPTEVLPREHPSLPKPPGPI